jgi:hypothetical protein
LRGEAFQVISTLLKQSHGRVVARWWLWGPKFCGYRDIDDFTRTGALGAHRRTRRGHMA